jgi:hypothetical protein
MSGLLNRILAEETGAVAVVVAIAFPVLLLAGVLAVDISNWNVHKRQLQIQADAGALAGASAFQFPCDSTVNSSVLSNAEQYAGDATYGAGRVNTFDDIPDSEHHVLYNSTTFYGGRTKSDPGAPALTGNPCNDSAIDVKATETNVSAFFGHFLARHIDATARAQLKVAAGIRGLMPMAVPDPSTVQGAWVQFFNEATGVNIGSPVKLTQGGTSNNMAMYATPTTTVDVSTDKLGVRAIISGSNDNNCADDGVECYDQSGTTTTLLSVRRWPTTDPDTGATQPQPWVSDLRLAIDPTDTSPCATPYFADIPLSTSPCTMKVFATVHFSTTSGSGVTNLANQAVSATIGGQTITLSPPSNTNPATSDNIWTGRIPVATSSGSSQLGLIIDQRQGKVHGSTCSNNNNNNSACKLTMTDVQRVYGASALTSGPLGMVQIDEVDPPGRPLGLYTYANSIPKCTSSPCNHKFVVTLGINTLHVATAGERPTVLRLLFNQQNSSQNQSLVCDPADRNLVDELTNGCNGDFRIAKPNECDTVQKITDIASPWPCVETKGGEQPNAIAQAMKARIMGGSNSCDATSANHWSSYPNFPAGDKRIVPLFLTTFGAFEGSGHTTVPIVSFAEFYITGWTSQGSGQPTGCNNDPVPSDTKGGYLVGHFIKRVIPDNGGDTGQDCKPTDLSPCTAVLTK